MTRTLSRAGAFASVATLFAALLGTGLTGAVAQDQAEPTTLETVTTDSIETAGEADARPRFVSQPVVQALPEPGELALTDAQSLRELVAAMPDMADMSEDMRCLAQAVYFESRGEPLAGQLAVARVVINRAESELFPDDYCSVVTQRAQFSFVRGGAIPAPKAGSAAWSRAKAIARIAHQELWDSEASDSLYFHASYVTPRWARTKVTRARIDSHIFYR